VKDYKEEKWKIRVDEFKGSKVIGKNNQKLIIIKDQLS